MQKISHRFYICGKTPAHESKLTKGPVCKKHHTEAIIKYGIAIGAAAASILLLLIIF